MPLVTHVTFFLSFYNRHKATPLFWGLFNEPDRFSSVSDSEKKKKRPIFLPVFDQKISRRKPGGNFLF